MDTEYPDSAAAQDDLVEIVRGTIASEGLILPGEKTLVAVSGGPDSVCLLHVLRRLGCPIEVAHFDHQTRNGESRQDAAFVTGLCKSFGVACHMGTAPVEEEAAASSHSFEEYARLSRYEHLLAAAADHGCHVLATGHHADDQAETVLMRVLRGASPQGLTGIPPKRTESGIRIVRPLIQCTREAIERYLAENDLESRVDRTNLDRDHLRNRIRHDLLPQLRREYNPGLTDALIRLADVQRVENDYLRAQADAFHAGCIIGAQSIDRARFQSGHPALQRRAILTLVHTYGIDCGYEIVVGAAAFVSDGPTGRSYDLGGVLLRNSRRVTEVVVSASERDTSAVVLNVPGDTSAFGQLIRARRLGMRPSQRLADYCTPTRQVFDADRLGMPLSVRLRKDGDRFSPLGLGGSKKLKDYFIDKGMTMAERDSQPLLVGPHGIAWVIGLAIDESVAVTSATRRFLELEVLHAD